MEQSYDFLAVQVNKGRRITRILMAANILLILVFVIISIMGGVSSFSSLISAFISIIISAFLYAGSKVAKWIYIVSAGIASLRFISFLAAIMSGGHMNDLTLSIWLIVILPFLINVITSFILIYSESVNEFLYKQAN